MCFYFIIQFLVPPSSSDLCVQQHLREAPSFSSQVSLPPGTGSSSLAPGLATFQDCPPPLSWVLWICQRQRIGGTRLLEGCDHPSKGLLLGDISEVREAAAWTLILLGGVAQLSESSSVSLGRAGLCLWLLWGERECLWQLLHKSP